MKHKEFEQLWEGFLNCVALIFWLGQAVMGIALIAFIVIAVLWKVLT